MTEQMAFDVQKISIFMLMIIVSLLQGVSGLIIDNTNATSCDGSRANITFTIDLENGTILTGSEIWYYEATIIATRLGGVFSPQGNYTSRLHTYSTYGIALDNVTDADAGRYLFVFSYYSPTPQGFKTATATLTVKVTPSENCMPSYRQSGNLAICELNQAANCGSPRLEPMWTHTSGNSFTVVKADKYTCCTNGSILMDCYRGSSTFCKTFDVADTGRPRCQLELKLGLGLGIPCVITGIVVVIFIVTGYKYAYILGLVLGVGLGITFQVSWIIIASLIATGNECKHELGLGLGLGSAMPAVIAYIVSVIFVFFVVSIFKGIPKRVELGKGILTGLLFASVIGIIVVYLIYDNLKQESTCKEYEQMTPEPIDKKSKTNNPGPNTVHTRTQNKFEPKTISKQTNDRQQPVPPLDIGFEDTPKFCQLPLPPQNGKIKDRNLRTISATIDDTPGLATKTPRPNKLPPLTPKRATVQEEDASEEPRKKRKKKRKPGKQVE